MKLTIIFASIFAACSLHAATIDQLQTEITQLQQEVAALKASSIQQLAPFIRVDPNPENGVIGPNIVFSGANIHIVDGTGATQSNSGRGSLIVGYDEVFVGGIANRGGSHNLVVGRYHNWQVGGFANLICGEFNTSRNLNSGGYGQFLAGCSNQAFSAFDSVSGGEFNEVEGQAAVVTGGRGNGALNEAAVVLGGSANLEYGYGSVTLGGIYNTDMANPLQYSVTQ
jgi:hypothetical protein